MNINFNLQKNTINKRTALNAAYSVITGYEYHPDLGYYSTYGIKAETLLHKEEVTDISVCEKTVSDMVALMNMHNLSPVHMRDVVTDMLP